MANALYGKGKEKLLKGEIDLTTDTIKAYLVSNGYTPTLGTDEFVTSISAHLLGTPVTLTTKTATLGVFNADDVLFAAVAAGATAKAVVLAKDTGVAGSSPLLAYIDTIAGFPVATNGGDIEVIWDDGAYKVFAI